MRSVWTPQSMCWFQPPSFSAWNQAKRIVVVAVPEVAEERRRAERGEGQGRAGHAIHRDPDRLGGGNS